MPFVIVLLKENTPEKISKDSLIYLAMIKTVKEAEAKWNETYANLIASMPEDDRNGRAGTCRKYDTLMLRVKVSYLAEFVFGQKLVTNFFRL